VEEDPKMLIWDFALKYLYNVVLERVNHKFLGPSIIIAIKHTYSQ